MNGDPQQETVSVVAKTSRSAGYASLDEALDAAQRVIQPVTEFEKAFPENLDARFLGHNPQQSMVAHFCDGSVRMQGAGWEFEVSRPESATVAIADGEQVEYHHSDGVVESYDNQEEGFHHSLIVASRPVGAGAGRLRMQMDVKGLEVANDPTSPGDLCFIDAEGRAVVAYRGLKAWDATGREMAASMRPRGAGFELTVNDSNAVYPLHIDPVYFNLEQFLQTEMAGSGRGNDQFGSAVALDGDTAVITSRLASSLIGKGRAYVFTREAGLWSLEAEIWASDGTSHDEFGFAVDLDGDTLVVGAWKSGPTVNNEYGSAYIFKRSGQAWAEEAKLTAPTPVGGGQFGYSVALDGDDVLVGAYQGGAYLFRRTGGTWQFQSQPAASATAYGFGMAVALEGDTMLIGAPREAMGHLSQAGAAYLFTRNAGVWTQILRIPSPILAAEQNFGESVALEADVAAICAPRSNTVTIYGRNSQGVWNEEQPLELKRLHTGRTVAISGETILVGSQGNDGVANLYQRAGPIWEPKSSFSSGYALAIDGGTVLLSAPGNQGGGVSSDSRNGAAFVHEFDGTDWPLQQRLTMGNSRENVRLGSSLAMQGNTVFVGASEAVYIFEKADGLWQMEARLMGEVRGGIFKFGSQIVLDGDTAAISSVSDSHRSPEGIVTENVGSVTVFTRSAGNWTQQQKLYASNFARSDNFGFGIALHGNNLLIGAPETKVGTSLARGSTYWFQRSGSTWTQKSIFNSSVSNDNQRFGSAIAIDRLGQTAVIGARTLFESESGSGYYAAGRAFIFTFNGGGWSQQATLQTPAAMAGPHMWFGSAVAIEGDTVFIGAPGADLPDVSDPLGKAGVGRCHVFKRSGNSWSHQAALNPLDGNQSTAFGKTVLLSGSTAVIGASGSVELYSGSGASWTLQNVLHSTAEPGNPSFGRSIALDGGILAVGIPAMDKVVESIQRSYPEFGGVEMFRISPNSTTVAITQPAANPIALADTTLNLLFRASIDTRGEGGPIAVVWSKLSGPGNISFSNPSAEETFAKFSAVGAYMVQCAVTHAGNTITRSHMVLVDTKAVMTFRQGENAYQQETATVREDQAGLNSGAAEFFAVGSLAPSKKVRSLMSFDLLLLPPSAVIHEISLETTTSASGSVGTVSQLELRLLTAPFAEGLGSGIGSTPYFENVLSGTTWKRQTDSIQNTNWYGIGHSGTTVLSTVPGFNAQSETGTSKIFGSTQEFVRVAQSAIPGGRLNLVIRAPESEQGGGDNLASFYSDDAENPARRPCLRITYSAALAPKIASGNLAATVGEATSLRGITSGATSLIWKLDGNPGAALFSDPASPRGSVTFNEPGSYPLKLSAGNSYGETFSTIQVQVEAPDPALFSGWQQQMWPGSSNPALIGADRDPDLDGIVNLLEWALHLDPKNPDAAKNSMKIQEVSTEYRYIRRKTLPGEAVFQVEWNDDLEGAWSSVGVGEESTTSLTETSESVLVSVPLGPNGRRFVRLGVTKL